jgi:riboflavin kinase/FMN adenylyltransferase
MHIYNSLSELPRDKLAITIGTFDGVHTGHQKLLNKLKSFDTETAIITFLEHPLKTLRPPGPIQITSTKMKLELLEKQGINHLVLIPFQEVMNLTYDQFLDKLPVSHLILGVGSIFGKNREGTQARVETWAKNHNVHVEYMEKIDNVSSSRIREVIALGDFSLAETLLGHTNFERPNGIN